jgi:hypothetical protein
VGRIGSFPAQEKIASIARRGATTIRGYQRFTKGNSVQLLQSSQKAAGRLQAFPIFFKAVENTLRRREGILKFSEKGIGKGRNKLKRSRGCWKTERPRLSLVFK